MTKILHFIAFFTLLSSFAFAQTRLPARQVSVDTGNFGTINAPNGTAQEALDWLDDNIPATPDLTPYALKTQLITNMTGLVDVTVTGPAAGQFLIYDGSLWRNVTTNFAAPGGGGGNVTNLNDLADVNAGSPASGQFLAFNGSLWAPADPPSGGGGTFIYNISTNFYYQLNSNFGLISQDLVNIYAYLVGGTQTTYEVVSVITTNESGLVSTNSEISYANATNIVFWRLENVPYTDLVETTPRGVFTSRYPVYWFTEDSASNQLALVQSLRFNQDITKTNFIGVNENFMAVSNLFYDVYNKLGTGMDGTVYATNFNWAYAWMQTNYATLSTALGLNFPNFVYWLTNTTPWGGVEFRLGTLEAGALNTNFSLINFNFGIISQDFRNAEAYIAGSEAFPYVNYTIETQGVPTTNIILTAVSSNWYSTNPYATGDGSASNSPRPALVPQLQRNQDITQTNFIWVNYNTGITTNFILQLANLLDITNSAIGGAEGVIYTNMMATLTNVAASFTLMDTNYSPLPTGLSFLFPNVMRRVNTNLQWHDTRIGLLEDTRLDASRLETNTALANFNFNIVSQDFRNVHAFLLGGTQTAISGVTTQSVAVTSLVRSATSGAVLGTNVTVYQFLSPVAGATTVFSEDGSATNAALVRALQYNQDLYRTNFIRVNTNTYLTTNLFLSIAGLMGVSNNVGGASGVAYTNLMSNLTQFAKMETDFTVLPTNLVLNFPNLIQPLQNGIDMLVTSNDTQTARIADLEESMVFSATINAYSTNPTNNFVLNKFNFEEQAWSVVTNYTLLRGSNFNVTNGQFRIPVNGWYLFQFAANHFSYIQATNWWAPAVWGGLFRGIPEVPIAGDGDLLYSTNRYLTSSLQWSATYRGQRSVTGTWIEKFTTNDVVTAGVWVGEDYYGSDTNNLAIKDARWWNYFLGANFTGHLLQRMD